MSNQNLIDSKAEYSPMPDMVRHLLSELRAGRISMSAANKKAPGRWGFVFARNGRFTTVYIPE